MKCTRCGYEQEKETTVCPECGQDVLPNDAIILMEDEKPIIPTTIYMPAQESSVPPEEKVLVPQENALALEENPAENALAENTINETAVTRTAYIEEADDYVLEKEWNFIPLILGILITLLCIGAAGYSMYYAYNYMMNTSSKDYKTSVQDIIQKVNSANQDFAAVFEDKDSFSVEEIKKVLPAVSDSFGEATKGTDSMQIPSKHSDSHEKLLEAIRLNRLIYQQLGTVLESPLDSNSEGNINLLSTSIDDCANNYAGVKIDDIEISLPDVVLSLPEKCSSYVKKQKTEYAQVMTYINSFSRYFDEMIKLFTKLDTSKADFVQEVKNARNKAATWESVLSQIENSEGIVRGVKTNYLKLSVPSQLKNTNKGFSSILDTSLNYYSKLRTAVLAERSFKKEGLSETEIAEKLESFDKMYENAEKINSSNRSKYQRYMTDMNSSKDRFMKPEYVMDLIKNKK